MTEPGGTYMQFTCMCTVFGCPKGILVTVPHGTQEEMQAACAAKLRDVEWDTDHMGVLCPDHKASHKLGTTPT